MSRSAAAEIAQLAFFHWISTSARRSRWIDPGSGRTGHWSDYSRGVAAMIAGIWRGIGGANLVIKSDVPIGAGLSSSAAIEVSVAFALLAVVGRTLDRREIVAFVSVRSTSLRARSAALWTSTFPALARPTTPFFSTAALSLTNLLHIPSDVRIVVCNTMVKHELSGGEYNQRRADCEDGVRTPATPDSLISALCAIRHVTAGSVWRGDAGAGLPPVSPRCLRECSCSGCGPGATTKRTGPVRPPDGRIPPKPSR